MDISSIGGTALAEDAKAIYQIACMRMAQHSENIAEYLILDSVEISNEAMEKYMAEKSVE